MFELTNKQRMIAENFVEIHDCHLEDDQLGGKKIGAIGGRLTWCFTTTGLGTIVIVKCACGESKDLTLYDEW